MHVNQGMFIQRCTPSCIANSVQSLCCTSNKRFILNVIETRIVGWCFGER